MDIAACILFNKMTHHRSIKCRLRWAWSCRDFSLLKLATFAFTVNFFVTMMGQHASFQESDGDDNDSVDPQDSSVDSGYADTETGHKERADAQESSAVIAKQETKNVVRLKLATLLVLVSAAIGIAAFTYLYLTHSELAAFSHQFADDSEKSL
jgi:hypothetical protein